jgi:glycosyltransferase involved in cell wall biosynthesis
MITIVIPTYNEEDYLSLLLSSIRNQSFTDYEIIVADNNSSDNTTKIATQYGAKVVPGGLPGAGRNSGASYSKENLILFLDADIILQDRNFLKDIINEFEERKLGVATCEIKPLSDKIIDIALHNAYNIFINIVAPFVPHAPGFCILVDRDIHNLINGFDEEIKLAEDTDYVKRAAKYGKFSILKSHKAPVSVRRLDRDGRLNITVKYILAGIHMMTTGNIKTDIFKYEFGHEKKK